MIFCVIRAIIFSIYAIMTFKVTAFASADAFDSISFLKDAFNSWVSNDVACFNFDVLVCLFAAETQRDSSSYGYPLPPVREAS